MTAPVASSADPGPEPVLDWLPLDRLVVDDRYQRDASRTGSRGIINKICREFRWRAFQPPTVAPLGDGTFAIIDGQHRVEAARKHPLIDRVPCYVVEADDLADQADGFVRINADRRQVPGTVLHQARARAGDGDALQLEKVCHAAGVRIARYRPAHGCEPAETVAVGSIRKLIFNYGEAPVREALETIRAAHPETRDALRAPLIKALAVFHASYRRADGFDRERLIRVVGEQSPLDLVETGRTSKKMFGGSASAAIVAALRHAYNRNLGAAKRLPEAP
ncbi:DUF6551 family protein [Oceanibacterium hippocampi]|uniref:ParB-like nuclease domain protein n=1 Tax=Oceanibacterium hippocampi TaxID=745714 RepID=A0A1Y5U095_9PROT|nr:DUF6551 family protein [Oceanibacterium hippocampi]SLN77270.1 ParB-like nuclease domain protein [Oceanibacterium hippocampi]